MSIAKFRDGLYHTCNVVAFRKKVIYDMLRVRRLCENRGWEELVKHLRLQLVPAMTV